MKKQKKSIVRMYLFFAGLFIVCCIVIFGWGIYHNQWQNALALQVSRIIPYPALIVDGESIPVSTYVELLRTMERYWVYQSANSDVLLGIPGALEIRERLVRALIEEKIIQQYARAHGIVVTQQAIDTEWEHITKTPEDAERALNFIERAYAWNSDKYKQHVLRPMLLRRAVLSTLEQQSAQDESAINSKADALYARLVGGEDFSSMARAESDDAVSAARGGDIGYFPRGSLAPQAESAIFATPIGSITKPVRLSTGYAVYAVDDVLYTDAGVPFQASVRHIIVRGFDFNAWLESQQERLSIYRLVN